MKYKLFNYDFKETDEHYLFHWEDKKLNVIIRDSYDKERCTRDESIIRFLKSIIDTLLNPRENAANSKMKTPIQIIIDKLEHDTLNVFFAEGFIDWLQQNLPELLEVEKDIIMNAYNNPELGDPEQYYNEIFNTKKK